MPSRPNFLTRIQNPSQSHPNLPLAAFHSALSAAPLFHSGWRFWTHRTRPLPNTMLFPLCLYPRHILFSLFKRSCQTLTQPLRSIFVKRKNKTKEKKICIVYVGSISGIRLPGFESCFHHSPAVRTRESYVNVLLSYLKG